DDSNLDPDGTTRYTRECKEHHTPLLWVCHTLRDIVYSRHAQNYILTLTNVAYKPGLHDVDGRCPWILCHEYDHYSTHHLAKLVVVEADLQCICSGMALKVLSCAPYDNCVFSMARTLAFTFTTDDGLEIPTVDPSVAMANITAFAQRLHQMAPKACELRIFYQNPGDYVHNDAHHMGSLIKGLLRITNRFVYELEYEEQPVHLDFGGVCHLVHIDYYQGLNDVQIVPLARQCAQTLQFLKVCISVGSVSEYSKVSGLVCDNDGGYVQYPCLRNLTILSRRWAPGSPRPVFDNAVPFPALQHLTIGTCNPFGDDTLFRGNAATLESLNIEFDWDTVTILRDRQVFTHNSHPKLRCVVADNYKCIGPNRFATATDYMQFVLSIGPHAYVRKIPSFFSNRFHPRALALFGSYPSIQVLDLARTEFTFSDVVTLIKSLPLLSVLKTRYPSLGPMPDGVTKAGFAKYMLDTHGPVGKHFRHWHFPQFYMVTVEAVECVLQLALICPRFHFIALDEYHRVRFTEPAKGLISSPPFEKHRQRLERLTPSGYSRESS
ncbi:hypothetical protein GGI16_007070, partial [Coemansia sp. S142-1]